MLLTPVSVWLTVANPARTNSLRIESSDDPRASSLPFGASDGTRTARREEVTSSSGRRRAMVVYQSGESAVAADCDRERRRRSSQPS